MTIPLLLLIGTASGGGTYILTSDAVLALIVGAIAAFIGCFILIDD